MENRMFNLRREVSNLSKMFDSKIGHFIENEFEPTRQSLNQFNGGIFHTENERIETMVSSLHMTKNNSSNGLYAINSISERQ